MFEELDRYEAAKLIGVFVAALLGINAFDYLVGAVANGELSGTELGAIVLGLVVLASVLVVRQQTSD